MADHDLIVIGGGSGGVRAARVAAGLGARVALVEEDRLGGTCVNAGCIPKKLLVYGSGFGAEIEDAAAYGWTTGLARPDWAALIAAKDREIARLNGVYRRLLEQSGVAIVPGRALLTGPHDVVVDGRSFTTEHVLVATGSVPEKPAIPGIELAVTSNEAFHLPALPGRVVIAGGGYIAVEFAGILAGLGSEVTIVHRGEQLLRGFDGEVRVFVGAALGRRGIELRLGHTIERIDRSGTGLRATLSDGSVLDADLVLCATGRIPRSRGFGLEALGVELGPRGGIVVDARFRTSVPSIHAVGDVIDRVALTPVAIAEGTALARYLFGGAVDPFDYAMVPTAVFGRPQIGAVGLSEERARELGRDVRVFRSEHTPLRHTLTGRGERAFMKLVVDAETDRVLGVHLVAADAAEILQGFAVALTCGATKADLDRTIGIHPTAAEELVTLR